MGDTKDTYKYTHKERQEKERKRGWMGGSREMRPFVLLRIKGCCMGDAATNTAIYMFIRMMRIMLLLLLRGLPGPAMIELNVMCCGKE